MFHARVRSRLFHRILALTKPLQRLSIRIAGEPFVTAALLSNEYFRLYPELAGSGLHPLFDYLLWGAAEGRDPHALFDSSYYLDQNPDVASGNTNPLLHFLRYGASEYRNPHPLFDVSYYFAQQPGILRSGVNPLVDYIRHGSTLPVNPHPLFDTAYYLHQRPGDSVGNPLIDYLCFGQRHGLKPHPLFEPEFYALLQPWSAEAKKQPLIDYIREGSREGLPPNPRFDPQYYRTLHAKAIGSSIEPLTHYVLMGRRDIYSTRPPRFESDAPDHYLPVTEIPPAEETVRLIDVIVPIYAGLNETRRCVESLLASRTLNRCSLNLVLINDATPESELATYVHMHVNNQGIDVIEHATNSGFVATANEAMALHPDRDVILLNSDTEVYTDWADRLAAHAYSGRIASVSPFSNNATLCSYPKPMEDNSLPPRATGKDLDAAFRLANANRHCHVPTTVGFCMYIRRDALQDIGFFDEETFGKGYGEENDFCIRALNRGWENLLAADTFVYHAGAVSFGASSQKDKEALSAVLQKHPRYLDYIEWHSITDPANAFRIAATAYRLTKSGIPRRLSISHSLGGGTQEHIQELERLTHDQVAWLRLTPAENEHLRLSCARPGFEFSVLLHRELEYELLIRLLQFIGIERVHVHHVLGFGQIVERLLDDLAIPFDVTLHDHYFICARVTVTDPNGRYCGEGPCEYCSSNRLADGSFLDLFSWRAKSQRLLNQAERVIAPSDDIRTRFLHYFPSLSITAAWHEYIDPAPVAPRPISQHEPLRVAVLGLVTTYKGYLNLQTCASLCAKTEAPVDFLHIGGVDPILDGQPCTFNSTSWYRPGELDNLIKQYAPHIVWFPGQCPEAFSFTLSACIRLGLPVAVPNIGAFPERVTGRPWTWVLPWHTSPEDWLAFFVRIREQNFLAGDPPQPATDRQHHAETDYYPAKYLSNQRALPRSMAKRVTILPSSFANGQVQACGYVRLIQPLTHPAVNNGMTIEMTDCRLLFKRHSDALIVQRTSVTDIETAERIIDHCRRGAVRLIYEIDDDLFDLPENHPEYGAYGSAIRAARFLARSADVITVSTEPLRTKLLAYNSCVITIPNWLDERIWPQHPVIKAMSAKRGLRAVYMGSCSHKPDLEMLESIVRKLKRDFDFDLDVIGVGISSDWFNTISIPDGIAISYVNFAAWFRRTANWDIGLAPLQESSFNASKSAIKVYEYASVGLPTVASAVTPYKQVIADGSSGLLCANTETAWYDALASLCSSPRLIDNLREGTLRARTQWTLAANAEELRRLWREALFCTPV